MSETRMEARALEELLADVGQDLVLGGNRPLDLDDTDRVWLVVEGTVEIFAVRRAEEDGAAGGARTHLASASAGEMVFGVGGGRQRSLFGRRTAKPASPAALVAVAHPGTRLLESDAKTLTQLAREPRHVPVLAAAVEGWVSALFRQVPRKEAPQRFTELKPGAEVELGRREDEGEDDVATGVARTAEGVVWVRHVAGRSHFLGREELGVEPADLLLPVSDETWLVADGRASLSCVATGHLLRSGTLWDGLEHFHDLFLRYVALQVEATEDEERQRLERRLELDGALLEGAHARLAAVLDKGDRKGGAETFEGGSLSEAVDPFFAVCRLAGAHQGLEVRRPVVSTLLWGTHGMQRIADASYLRFRRVLLRDDWWRHDNGALVAAIEEDVPVPEGEKPRKRRRPVALLPTSATSYELVDPADQSRRPVDAEIAETFAADAYMLYPSLPQRPLRPWDLVRLALGDRGRDLLTILLMGVGGGLLSVLVPIVTGHLYGRVIPGADLSQVMQMTTALIAAAVGAAAFQITRQVAVLRLSGKIDGSLQAAVWDRLLSLPSAFFRRFTVGDLANRAMGVDSIRDQLLGNVTTSFLGLVFSVTSFALLFYYSWRLALMASLLIAVLLAVTALLAWLQLKHQRELQEIQGRLQSLVFGLIRGISKLRTAGAEKRAYALWAERFAEQRRSAFKARRVANVQSAWNAFYGLVTTLSLFALMGVALEADLEISRFLAFSAAFGQVQSAALTFVGILSSLLSMVPTYERLSPILEASPEVDESKTPSGELSGDIEMGHVHFRYRSDGPLILSDVSFVARPGEFVALVGPSGSGKSTALRLLLGFEEPDAGSIYYDGQDLATLDLQSVRRQIGVVLQSSRPMSGDIYTNIVGTSNLGIDAAWEASRMAGLEDDIKAMPMGMHTVISEGAGTFSGGQLQRLMIARAIVNRPRILFFDEATSALDNRTQEIVSKSLEKLKATRIVVAHRLSTIQNADRIYVIDRGRVVESGTYTELVAEGGLFARLAERQVA